MATHTKKILLIEDSHTDSFIIHRILREYPSSSSHQVITFDTLAAAKHYFHHNAGSINVDLILLDLHLPDSADGYDSFLEIKSCMTGSIPIVALTGSENRELAMDLIRMGLSDFVNKAHVIDHPDLLGRAIDFAFSRHTHTSEKLDTAYPLPFVMDSH